MVDAEWPIVRLTKVESDQLEVIDQLVIDQFKVTGIIDQYWPGANFQQLLIAEG